MWHGTCAKSNQIFTMSVSKLPHLISPGRCFEHRRGLVVIARMTVHGGQFVNSGYFEQRIRILHHKITKELKHAPGAVEALGEGRSSLRLRTMVQFINARQGKPGNNFDAGYETSYKGLRFTA